MADSDLSDVLSERALDAVDTVVATVNDKAVRPAIVAARGIVFGVVIAVVAVTVFVLFCVGFIRVTTIAGHRIWASYIVLGLLFSAVGAVLYAAPWPAPRCLNGARSSSSEAGRRDSPPPSTARGPSWRPS